LTTTAEVDQLTTDDLRKARLAIEHCFESGWTDGLPVVPPTQAFVDEFLGYTRRDPDEVLCSAYHLNRTCTVRDAAANAVMAGCKPEYFTTFLAIVEAFQQIGPVMSQSTTGRAYAIVINGPIRERIGVNCTGNIFGPGDRANATLGRALRLVLMNTFDIRPHDLDQSTHGTPGKYTLCIGENEEESPWEPLHVEFGLPKDASTVLIQQARSTMHIDHRTTQVPEQILYTIARSMSYMGHATASASAGGRILQTEDVYHRNLGCVVVLGPEHAGHIGGGGWSKQQVRQYLFEHWGNTVGELRLCGEPPEVASLPDDYFVGASGTADSIKIVVAGANNAGESTILPGYGRHAGPIVIEESRA
jgi:hypothetical protein